MQRIFGVLLIGEWALFASLDFFYFFYWTIFYIMHLVFSNSV